MFPWGLLVVNATGSALAGLVVARTTGDLRLLLLTGLCGAYTTFSGFAWATVRLFGEARWAAWLSVAVFPVACVGAFAVVWQLVR
jgi:CrcB protein